MRWTEDFVDLRSHFLSDADAERIYENNPGLFDSCITCRDEGIYYFRGQEYKCDCDRQMQLYKHYLNANIGLLYQRLDFQDYEGDLSAIQILYDYLNNYHAMLSNGLGMMLSGDPGVGKTLIVMLGGKELVKLGCSVYATTMAEMIEQFTAGWKDNEEKDIFEKKVVKSKILVLDDIGKEFQSKLTHPTLDYVLRQRVMNARPTLITTNIHPANFGHRYGTAILSLLSERSLSYHVEGADFRQRAKDRSLSEALSGEQRPIF